MAEVYENMWSMLYVVSLISLAHKICPQIPFHFQLIMQNHAEVPRILAKRLKMAKTAISWDVEICP